MDRKLRDQSDRQLQRFVRLPRASGIQRQTAVGPAAALSGRLCASFIAAQGVELEKSPRTGDSLPDHCPAGLLPGGLRRR
jgi:hypothetical protein